MKATHQRRILQTIPFLLILAALCVFTCSTHMRADDGSATPQSSGQPHLDRPSYAPDRIIFKLAKSAAQRDGQVSAASDARSLRLWNLVQRNRFLKADRLFRGPKSDQLRDIHLAHLPPGVDVETVLEQLQSDPDIEWAEPDYYRYAAYEPNDAYYHQFPSGRAHLDRIEAQSAWDVTTGDPNMVIAIIDSGVNYNHEDLFDNIWVNPGEVNDRNADGRIDLHDIDLDGDKHISQDEIDAASDDVDGVFKDGHWCIEGNGYTDDIMGWDFVDVGQDQVAPGEDYDKPDNNPDDFDGHGTMVAGIAAAVGNNGIGVTGVTWNCRIMILRTACSDPQGVSRSSSGAITQALKYAAYSGADVINMSLGGYYPCFVERVGLEAVTESNGICVAAAGNENPGTDKPMYPASYDEVISVAYTRSSDDTKAGKSNYGLGVDVTAPGNGILNILTSGTYAETGISGTSFSSPVVAGVAALVKSVHPSWHSRRITNQVIATADGVDQVNPGYEGKLGAGRVNARKAVAQEFLGPRLKLVSTFVKCVDEECGVGQHKAELYVTIRNFGNPWGDVTLALSSADPHVTVQNATDTAFYGIIHSQRRVTNAPNPYAICVDPGVLPGHTALFTAELSVNGVVLAREPFGIQLDPFDRNLITDRPEVVTSLGAITTDPCSLSAEWSSPPHSRIQEYDYSIGRAPGHGDIIKWGGFYTQGPYAITYSMACVPLIPHQQYYVNVKPRNTGVVCIGFSNPVTYVPVSKDASLTFTSDVYSASNVIEIELSDLDLKNQTTYNARVRSNGGDRETVVLRELFGSGVYRGSIETSSGPVDIGDGLLQVAHGETITATYEDMDDGMGNLSPPDTCEAVVDCEPPVISHVQVAEALWTKATVTFDTSEPACGTVRYGLSADGLDQTAIGMWDPCHFTVELPDLESDTTYFFAVVASDKAGNWAVDDNNGGCFQLRTQVRIPVLFVDGDAPPRGDGSSWASAYRYLQDALAMAESLPAPLEIRVAQGRYTPDSDSVNPEGSHKREAAFRLVNGVALKGGYAGLGEPNADARNVDTYETILSGDLEGNDEEVANVADLIAERTRQDNAYHVMDASGTDATAILDGVFVTGGNANGPSGISGGALYNNAGSPTLTDCTFAINSAKSDGGAVYNINNANPTLTRCVFNRNASLRGGAMRNELGSSPLLAECHFSHNLAETRGGAVWNYGGSPIMNNCVFIENVAGSEGGALMNYHDSTPTLNNCTFARNSATKGGGIRNDLGSNARLNNCILWDNSPDEVLGAATITYSDVQGGCEGEGNIDVDPLFAGLASGDYHLKSQAGRWDPVSESWIVDDVTSPCIDAGDPSSDVGLEPEPNGGRINMGAYGGTAQASKSP